MRLQAKRMASCAVMAALCVVLLLLGAVLELGIYAAPMFAGLCLIPIGLRYGRKYQITTCVAVGVLSFLLVPNMEENLLFAGLLGWYPALRPSLQKLPVWFRFTIKLAVFNVTVIAVEWLVLTLIAPEAVEGFLLAVLLALGNVTFLAYDFLLSKLSRLTERVAKLL